MRPPKPQPMSAISTCFVSFTGMLDVVSLILKAGKCVVQSIVSGQVGLCSNISLCRGQVTSFTVRTIARHGLRRGLHGLAVGRISSWASVFPGLLVLLVLCGIHHAADAFATARSWL